MKCLKCGTELNDGVHFCSNCGEKLKEQSVQKNDSSGKKDSKNNTNKTQEKIITFWKKRSLFGKIATISLLLFALLGLIAFLAGRIFAGIISVVAIATVIVAILMKKQVIKVPKTWISLMVVILSFVLVFPYFSLFKINISDFARYNWNEIALSEMLPKPKSPYGETIYNSEESVSLYVTKTKITQYEDYINKCQDKGFTIEIETKGNSFYAYNDKGYKLSLTYYEYNSEMHISLNSPMKLENITWSDSEMAKLLPIPESKLGKIYSDDENSYAVYIGNTTIDDYNTYVQACENKGFTIDAKKQEKSYTAKNQESYKVTINYEGNNVVYIAVTEPEFDIKIEVDCVENWIFSTYDVKIYIDDVIKDTLPHGNKKTYDIILKKGIHTISFQSADDETLKGEIQVEINKVETIKVKISCNMFGIDVETLAGTLADKTPDQDSDATIETNQVVITKGAEEFKGMNYKDAEKVLGEMGFTNFKYKIVDTDNEETADTIYNATITELFLVNSDFAKGDKFDKDSIITLSYYQYKAPATPRPVSYSTNDYETAKKGNTGVFSYKNKKGVYDSYWIIDFDAGYVYWFTDKNGEDFCDKVKIESGDLNDRITITWNDDGEQWSYYLHFKYKNHPETLVVNDNDGFAIEFTTANLDKALTIRNTKDIKEY